MPALTVTDLFCGAGGLSLGLQRAGFRVLAAHDHWERATETYSSNFDHAAESTVISPVLRLPEASLIAGGPPCQGFSSAGLRREDDHRNTLVGVFSSLVAEHLPPAFLFENVEGFLTGGSGKFVFDLLEPLIEAGYWVHLRKINAATFGIPQHRKRVIAIGGYGWDPGFPEPTHRAYGAPGASLGAIGSIKPTPTLASALEGLPVAVEVESRAPLDDFDHTFAAMKPEDLARASFLKPGQCMRDLPEEMWHESYRRRAFRRVMDGIPTERRGGPPAGLRRLDPEQPSKAITGGAVGEFLHPFEDRPLTTRECARIQTFPDEFVFRGPRRDRIQLIGNAVPPLLAQHLAQHLARGLRRAKPCAKRGALLSFVPTLSNGASPALQSVSRRVAERFEDERIPTQQLSLWP
jgi:DNA (cytosine-5)-methyltransferase 1